MLPKPRDDAETSNSFKIMLTVKNFVSPKIMEDVDLFISIYEVVENKTPKPLCENYVVENWSRNPELKDLERRNNLRVLFTDISKNDITGKRLYLICNVVSYFSSKAVSASRSDLHKVKTKAEAAYRKPVGVAAVEISELFTFKQGKSSEFGREIEVSAPFLPANSSESFESVFRKLVFEKRSSADPKSLWVTVNVMMGSLNQHPREIPLHPLVGGGKVAVARKIGLPEVILPQDFRNDLYVTLVSGEFSRLDRRSDRNVEVTVEVCNSDGRPIENSICAGEGTARGEAHSSVVYYHEGRPKWNEVVKVIISVDQFSAGSHIRFTFRHKSASGSKEKSQPPWAMAFLKLVSDHDKTTVKDGSHDLLVYKIEKRFDFEASCYLHLPFYKSNQYLLKQKSNSILTALPKDSFLVQTTLCSTKLTQNEGLLTLLNWKSKPNKISHNLVIFNQKVNGKEFVKFLPDVLDSLFSILTESTIEEGLDMKVFKSLINVIHLITEDPRYQQFVSVLDVYIRTNFSATLAYSKLLDVLFETIDQAGLNPVDLNQTMKSLKYIFKFVVQSRTRYVELNKDRGEEVFKQQLRKVLASLVGLMTSTSPDIIKGQEFCLKHVIQSIPYLITVFDRKELAQSIVRMYQNLAYEQLLKEKISAIKALVSSELFQYQECRKVLMPAMSVLLNDTIQLSFTNSEGPFVDLVPLCTEALGDILDALQRLERNRPSTTLEDVTTVANETLRTVIQSVANRQSGDPNAQAVVSNMISLFSVMTARHYSQYIDTYRVNTDPCGRGNLIDFVMEALGMFRDLMQNNVFPVEWASMVLLQNSVLLKALQFIADTIRDYLKVNFCRITEVFINKSIR